MDQKVGPENTSTCARVLLCGSRSDGFSWTVLCRQKPGMDVADGYVTFVRHSQDMLREKVNEEVYTERLFDVSSFTSPQS